MTRIDLDIVELVDGGTGRAAIRVRGLDSLPADPTFRIDPVDPALAEGGDVEWPSGPRRPTAVLATDDGIDLVLGPDVLESPLLLPGTPVEVSLIDVPAAAHIVWPAIATRTRRRRPVIVTDDLLQAERTAAEQKRRDAAAALAAATARAAEAETRTGTTAGRRARATKRPGPRLVADNAAAPGVTFGGPETVGRADMPAEPARPLQPFVLPAEAEASRALVAGPPAETLPAPVFRTETPSPRRVRQIAAFGGGLAVAAALVFAAVQMRVIDVHAPGAPASDAALTAARTGSTLRAVLATSGISPRGRTATGVDGPAALRLADRFLHGDGEVTRDQGEASFWLRHALSQSLDQESMKWALTQLGTIYAAPEGLEPDYPKARMLWDVAAGLGDPVALCFNASLYEHGLGVPRHKALARALYERARNAGGCAGLDEALARTR